MKKMKLAVALAAIVGASVTHAQIGPVAVSPGAPWQPAWATADYSIAVGSNAIAGLTQAGGLQTLTIAPAWGYTNQVAIGAASIAWGAGDVAMGGGAVAASQPALGVTRAATAIGQAAASWGTNSVAIGFQTRAGASSLGAPTSNPTISNATALGGTASAAANNSTAIGAGATAAGVNSVALGAGSVAMQANTVEIGTRRITGVSAGTAASDAVNVGQLQAAIAGIPAGPAGPAGPVVNEAAIVARAVSSSNSYTDQAINSLRREYSRAIAAVAATPMLPALAPGERAIAVAGGWYNGSQAIGVAVAQGLQDGALINAGFATAGGKPIVRGGAAWKF